MVPEGVMRFVANWSEVRMALGTLNLQLDLTRAVLLGTVPFSWGGCANSGLLLQNRIAGLHTSFFTVERFQCFTHVLIKYHANLLRSLE